MTRVHRNLPAIDEVLDLLDAAYDGWGSRDLFEWKYRYPGTAEDKHHLYVVRDDDMAAFARLYERELRVYGGERTAPVVVRGNAAVHPNHQGQGLYTALHEETQDYCDEREIDGVLTFNRQDNRSFRTSAKSDWAYRPVPLYVNVLSPRPVLEEYAASVLRAEPRLKRLASTAGAYTEIEIDGDRVAVDGLTGHQRARDGPRLTVGLSERALDEIVEGIGTDTSLLALARTGLGLLAGREVRIGDGSVPTRRSIPDVPADASYRADLDPDECEAMRLLCDRQNDGYDAYFRRTRDDIDHMLAHPDLLTIVWLDGDDGPRGIAPLYETPGDGATEVRVLDLLYEDERAFRDLLTAVEDCCRNRDVDIVATFADRRPDDDWLQITRHVLMWDDLSDDGAVGRQLADGKWRLGFYDVV